MIPKTSSKIRGKVEKVGLANVFHDSSRFGGPNRGKSCFCLWNHKNGGKSWPGQHFPRLKPFWRPKSWKMLARPTFFHFFHKFLWNQLANIFHDLSLENVARPTFSAFPRISEEVLFFTKMVEKVGLANIFHSFYDSKDFLKKSWKKWKKLAWPTFSTTQAGLEA